MVTAVIDVIHCRGKDNHCLHAPIGGVCRCNKAPVHSGRTHQKRRRTPRAQETVDNLASRSALTCKANAMHRHVGPFSLLSVPNRVSIPCSVISSIEAGFSVREPCQWIFRFSKAVDKAVVLEFRFASGAVVPVKSGSCTSEKSAHVSSQGSLEK